MNGPPARELDGNPAGGGVSRGAGPPRGGGKFPLSFARMAALRTSPGRLQSRYPRIGAQLCRNLTRVLAERLAVATARLR